MADILSLLTPAQLTGYVRELPEPILNSLEAVLPNRTINGRKTARVKGTRRPITAKYRAWDAEAPIERRRGAVEVQEIVLPPIAGKLPLNEDLQYKLQDAPGDVTTSQIVDALYDDAGNLATGVRNRAEVARGQFLQTGAVTISENGQVYEADYGLADDHQVDTSDITPWNASGTPLTDELAWVQKVQRDAQAPVVRAITTPEVRAALLGNEEYRQAFYAGAAAGTLPTLTPGQLDQVRETYGLPPLFIYDGYVPDDEDGVTRVIEADKFILVTATVGESQWGETIEAINLVASNAPDWTRTTAPGITVTQFTEPDPVTVWTKASAVFLPVAGDIAGLFVASVLEGVVNS